MENIILLFIWERWVGIKERPWIGEESILKSVNEIARDQYKSLW